MDPSKEPRQGRYRSRASRRATGSCRHASRFMSARIGPIGPRSSCLILSHQTVDSYPEDLILASQPEFTWTSFSGLAWRAVCEAIWGAAERKDLKCDAIPENRPRQGAGHRGSSVDTRLSWNVCPLKT